MGSALRQVEHEAGMGAMAAAAGGRAPTVLFAGMVGNGAGILVERWVDAVRIDELDDGVDGTLLRDVWAQVDVLHAAGIAHGNLHAGSILVDDAMQPWLVDFSRAQAAADEDGRTQDVVALRATLASLSAEPSEPVGARA